MMQYYSGTVDQWIIGAYVYFLLFQVMIVRSTKMSIGCLFCLELPVSHKLCYVHNHTDYVGWACGTASAITSCKENIFSTN